MVGDIGHTLVIVIVVVQSLRPCAPLPQTVSNLLAHLVPCFVLHLHWKGVSSILVSATVRASDVVRGSIFCSHDLQVKVQSLRQSGERVRKSTFVSLTNSSPSSNYLRDSMSSPNCSVQGSRRPSDAHRLSCLRAHLASFAQISQASLSSIDTGTISSFRAVCTQSD